MTKTEIKVREIGSNLDPNKKIFKVDPEGRTPALKADHGDGEFDLYICYENRFHKTKFTYSSNILHYFKSNKIDDPIYIKTLTFTASDGAYVDETGKVVTQEEAFYGPEDITPKLDESGNTIYETDPETGEVLLDENGDPAIVYEQLTGIKPGYQTEAQFYEATVGPVVAQAEIAAVIRKFNL
jgi:hypothetical protein